MVAGIGQHRAVRALGRSAGLRRRRARPRSRRRSPRPDPRWSPGRRCRRTRRPPAPCGPATARISKQQIEHPRGRCDHQKIKTAHQVDQIEGRFAHLHVGQHILDVDIPTTIVQGLAVDRDAGMPAARSCARSDPRSSCPYRSPMISARGTMTSSPSNHAAAGCCAAWRALHRLIDRRLLLALDLFDLVDDLFSEGFRSAPRRDASDFQPGDERKRCHRLPPFISATSPVADAWPSSAALSGGIGLPPSSAHVVGRDHGSRGPA